MRGAYKIDTEIGFISSEIRIIPVSKIYQENKDLTHELLEDTVEYKIHFMSTLFVVPSQQQ